MPRRDEPFDDKLSCRAVVQWRRVHEIEVRRLVVADGVHHRRIRAVRDGLAEARFLAFSS